MKVQELDDLTNWFKSNVLDYFQEGIAIDMKNTADGLCADSAHLNHTQSDKSAITEYEYPLSLLEHIIGIDRC